MAGNTNFPTWFTLGSYTGLVFCVVAFGTIVFYTFFRGCGTARQRVKALVLCLLSGLLLLPTLLWIRVRFSPQISAFEVIAMLLYVIFFGLLLPLSTTLFYCLFAQPRTLHAFSMSEGAKINSPSTSGISGRAPLQSLASEIPGTIGISSVQTQTKETPLPLSFISLPRYQAGVAAPFVFSEEIPWGWLEYQGGNFSGQRLALKRVVAGIGRAEEADIWLDDDLASRHHAELAWVDEQVYLTDCSSRNGLLLNGQLIQGTIPVNHGDTIVIGTHTFRLFLADSDAATRDLYDPLVNHTWRTARDLQQNTSSTRIPRFPLTLPANKRPTRQLSTPGLLRLPSRDKK